MGRDKIKERGQILLVTVMLLATALTIALSVSYTVQVETRLSKLKEKEKQALDAAEAGAETLLNSANNQTLSFSDMGEEFKNIEGEAKIETLPEGEFVTPLIEKDSSYTLYLETYDPTTNEFKPPAVTGNLTLYFGSEVGADSSNCSQKTVPALELELFYGEVSSIKTKRWVIDPCNNINGSNISTPTNQEVNFPQGNELFPPVTFHYSYNLNLTSGDAKLLVIRSLFESTKVGVKTEQGIQLPLQGKMIVSTATTQEGGVTKRIRAFQSFPQIPIDFLVTQF